MASASMALQRTLFPHGDFYPPSSTSIPGPPTPSSSSKPTSLPRSPPPPPPPPPPAAAATITSTPILKTPPPPSSSPHSSSSIPSPLLALPPELRLQIFTLALALPSFDNTTTTTNKTSPGPRPTTYHPNNPTLLLPQQQVQPPKNNALSLGLPLLLTSRQIYHETRTLPFTTNTFEFVKWYGSSVYSCRRWLSRLLPWQRRAVRVLDVWVVGREIVEAWRREEGWCVLLGLLSGEEGEGEGKVVVRAHVRGDDVWGVSKVVEGLRGCLEHGFSGDEVGGGGQGWGEVGGGRGEEGRKGKGRVKLEIVVEDLGLGSAARKKEREEKEEKEKEKYEKSPKLVEGRAELARMNEIW